MIITDRFVVLNNPKTGSSFVRTVLKELHERDARRVLKPGRSASVPLFEELFVPNIKVIGKRPRDQHGTFGQIPPQHRGKVIVSAVRNPYERLLSDFAYRFWVKYPPLEEDVLKRKFPHFPDLSLDDFIRLRDLETRISRLPNIDLKADIGYQTVIFIQMFFRTPELVFSKIDDRYIEEGAFEADMPEIAFLRTESLNQDLHEFLREQGYADDDVAFVLSHGEVNVTESPVREAADVWTDSTLSYMKHNERLLFRILESKKITYERPAA